MHLLSTLGQSRALQKSDKKVFILACHTPTWNCLYFFAKAGQTFLSAMFAGVFYHKGTTDLHKKSRLMILMIHIVSTIIFPSKQMKPCCWFTMSLHVKMWNYQLMTDVMDSSHISLLIKWIARGPKTSAIYGGSIGLKSSTSSPPPPPPTNFIVVRLKLNPTATVPQVPATQ